MWIHPSSLTTHDPEAVLRDGFYVYSEKVATSRTFVRDVSRVSAFGLLLFGAKAGEISLEKVQQTGKIELKSAGIHLTANRETALLMKLLQQQVQALFLAKARDPSSPLGQRGELVMQTVAKLLGKRV